MAQQTAVEWLQNRLNKILIDNQIQQTENLFEQAKQMEKEQIINAHGDEQSYLQDDGSWRRVTAEQYYNETYGK